MLKRLLAAAFSISILLSIMVYPASANEEFSEPDLSEEVHEINPRDILAENTEYSEDFILTCVSDNTSGSKMSNVLEHKNDTEVYEIEIDHSVYPEIALYAYTSGDALGATLFNFGGGSYLQINATNSSTSTAQFSPKGYVQIRDTSGGIEKYTITAKALTDDAGYTIAVGPKDAVDEYLGGPENAATVGRNIQTSDDMSQWINSYTVLLNGLGDWYRYTPQTDNGTYVGNNIYGEHSTAFAVYDAETLDPIYTSNPKEDRYLLVDSVRTRTVMQNRIKLEPGKTYLIQNYTPTVITPANEYDIVYRAYIGLPCVSLEKYSYGYPQAYTVQANKKATFYINVTNQPDVYRFNWNTTVYFNTNSFVTNASITSCTITAPNGMAFNAPNGRVQVDQHADLVDFLNNRNNIPINGRWKIEIEASKTINNLTFAIGTYVLRLDRLTAPQS